MVDIFSIVKSKEISFESRDYLIRDADGRGASLHFSRRRFMFVVWDSIENTHIKPSVVPIAISFFDTVLDVTHSSLSTKMTTFQFWKDGFCQKNPLGKMPDLNSFSTEIDILFS
ncbi:hypothetical protein CRE_30991 [Caenorhabditis remanei]|uniref:Uncharacterized protein n=1 Tax=Caenorhabditis remanei TaxID=31234 RepID=E3LTY9_CAERE|nr:hypothetical protein CRE_30991 [Caenorhabditis remanei]